MHLQGVYYVCNPLTKQWVALPPAPSSHRVAETAIGFITSRCSYKVVRVPELDSLPGSNSPFEVEVFCSELGVWSKFMMMSSSTKSFTRTWQFKPDGVPFKNKLHWLVNGETIVVFDPYKESIRVIDLPLELNSDMALCLGTCRDYLKVSQIAGGCLSRVLVVWKLEDYETGDWALEFKVRLKEVVLVELHHCSPRFKYLTAEVLAFHPSDEEVLYLRFDNRIVVCNVAGRTLEVVGECLEDSTFSIGTRGVFLLVHPCWPSLIPPLPST